MPELVTLRCPDCDHSVSGPDGGRGSAAWKLGTHRARAHGYRSPGDKRVRARENPDAPTAVSVIRDIGAELDTGRKSAPTEDELVHAFGRGLYTLSVGAASWLAETDPTARTEADREAIVDYLSIDARGARETMRPIGKALGRTKVNARYGRAIVDNIDVLTSVSEVAILGLKYRRYFRLRATLEVQLGLRPAPGQTVDLAPPPALAGQWPDEDGLTPAPVGYGTVVDPNLSQGIVVTREMVEQMQRQGGANGNG